MRIFLAGLLLAFSQNVYPCSFSTDCAVGERCIKTGYSLDGTCVPGGAVPVNPVYTPPSNPNAGKTCTDDYQCSAGARCLKTDYNTYGVCSG